MSQVLFMIGFILAFGEPIIMPIIGLLCIGSSMLLDKNNQVWNK
jgi:hypothetical protein